jgi:hypothetical protein
MCTDTTASEKSTSVGTDSSKVSSPPFKVQAIRETTRRTPDVERTKEEVTLQTEKTKPETTLEAYKEENGKEYIENLIDLGVPFDYLPEVQKEQINSISKYVKERINEEGEKPTIKNFVKYFNELRMTVGLQSDSTIENELDRLAGYADSFFKIDGVEEITKSIKSELAKAKNSRQMKRILIREIGKRII